MSRNLLSALLSHSRNVLFRTSNCHSTFFINLSIILLRNTINRPFTPDTIVQIFNQNTEQLPQEDRFGNLWRCLPWSFYCFLCWVLANPWHKMENSLFKSKWYIFVFCRWLWTPSFHFFFFFDVYFTQSKQLY